MEPFRIDIPDALLQDLKRRLGDTRWPGEISGGGWDYGSELGYVKSLCEYWKNEFDWRDQERKINSFSNYTTDIDDLNVHFIYEKGKGPDPLPLVITHGWPSTFAEMLDIIPMLTDPESHGGSAADSFDVVVPSIPGYGFSQKPELPGMNVAKVASIWTKLMTKELGYESFVAQGGDWGAAISTALGALHGDVVQSIHLTMASGLTDLDAALSGDEKKFLEHRTWWQENEGAYGHMPRTKPQTLSYGLNDSPAGLAAWIVEKWRSWSDCNGTIESRFTKDQLLTHITIYWVTQTLESSVRLYYETAHAEPVLGIGGKVEIPTNFASFPVEIAYPPREWIERFYNLRRFSIMSSGGHFAATEEPSLLADDIRSAFRFLRD